MNPAEALYRQLYGGQAGQGLNPFDKARSGAPAHIHPDIEFSLFGMTGTKEVGRGRDAYLAFVEGCKAALADRSDEIISITGADEQMVVIRARAWRKSAATGEELTYEWLSAARVEDGQVTYSTDMLDRDAQEFWGRIRG